MNVEQLSPGTVLADKYRLESVLGVGGMGTVYRAEHLALKAPVAVKVIDRKLEEGDITLARFMREAQSAAALRSPHVVQILDYGSDGGRPFMVMELLEGESLADRLKAVEHLSPEDTYRIILHVAKAVSKAHEAEIVHRDLKPDNIFLVHNEGDEIAKVLDFGVAKVEATALDGKGHTRTGSLLGTPYYMSPEQAQGNKDVDGRSDLWALGVIAFECLTGSRPFSSDGLGDLVLQICIRDIPVPSQYGTVPPGFDDWFEKACQREPEDRFQTARDLAEALRAALYLDLSTAPESRWALPADRPATVQASRPSLAEDATIDESDTRTEVEERPLGAAEERPAPSPERTTRPSGESSENWQVVPHDTAEPSAPVSARPTLDSTDPLAETYQPPTTRGGSVLFVAMIAILLGAAGVFGLRQIGVVDIGENESQKRERLKVIGSSSEKTTDKTASSADTDTEQDSRVTKKRKSSDQRSQREDAEQSKSAEDEGEGELSAEEAALIKSETTKLEQIEKEALEAVKGIAPGEDSEKLPKEDSPGQDEPPVTTTSGPKPVLPEGLDQKDAPPPPPPKPSNKKPAAGTQTTETQTTETQTTETQTTETQTTETQTTETQ